MRLRVDEEARALIESYDPVILARAVDYLYTKETRSSFAIEGETPSASRTERFVAALRAAPGIDPADKAALVRLQGDIVDRRYAASDWRNGQNFVGATVGGYREEVHFICPRPEDVPGLMDAWTALMRRVVEGGVPPVVAAAVSAFAFVFIHPFEDGNGRIHRFLMHHVLARRGYGPPDMILPVSAAILRDRRGYDAILESFSRPLFEFIRWRWTAGQELVVENDTSDLYRYFDATAFAEYLHDRVADTVRRGSQGRTRLHRGLRPGVRGGTRDRGHAGSTGFPVRATLHAEQRAAFRGQAPRFFRVGGRGGRGHGGGRPGSHAGVKPSVAGATGWMSAHSMQAL